MKDPNIREYLRILVRHWGTEVSGRKLAFIGLIVLAGSMAFGEPTNAASYAKIGGLITLGAALVLLIAVAPYDAWREERNLRDKAESQLSAEADIRGTIYYYPAPYNPFEDQDTVGSQVHLICDQCANHGRAECQIAEVWVYLDGPSTPADPFMCPVNFIGTVTKRGDRVRNCNARCILRGIDFIQLSNSRVRVVLVDSLGRTYENLVTVEDSRKPSAFPPSGAGG